jgi:hypothetical protein
VANYSDLTRRDQVLARLREANGEWVDGTELCTAEVGGSEGLKRLRELRQDGGYDIKMRRHPSVDRDIFQYRLVRPAPAYSEPSAPKPFATATIYPLADVEQEGDHMVVTPIEPPERYERPVWTKPTETESELKPGFIRRGVHLGRQEDGTFIMVYDGEPPEVKEDEYVPPPPVAQGQVGMGVPTAPVFKYREQPKLSEMGSQIMCPLCKGYRKPIYDKDPITGRVKPPVAGGKKRVIAYEDFCRDPRPGKSKDPCDRCNGFGVVPAT